MSENHLPLFTYQPQPDNIPIFPESATLELGGFFSEEVKISISLKKAKEESSDVHYLREQDVLGKNKIKQTLL